MADNADKPEELPADLAVKTPREKADEIKRRKLEWLRAIRAKPRNPARQNRPKRTLVEREADAAKLLKVPVESIKVLQKSSPHALSARNARDLILSHTQQGEDIVRFMLNCMNGDVPGINARGRIVAAEWLGLHCFGKPTETSVQLSMAAQKDGQPLGGLNDNDLETIARGLLEGATMDAPALDEGPAVVTVEGEAAVAKPAVRVDPPPNDEDEQ